MHQMGLSQSHASINKERIVDLSWGFGHSQGCGVGQVVIFSHHKGVKGIAGIQIGVLDRQLANGSRVVLDQLFFRFLLFDAVFGDKCDLTGDPGQLFNGNFQQKLVFFFHILQKQGVGHQDGEDMFIHRIWLQRQQPRLVGHIGDIVLLLDI